MTRSSGSPSGLSAGALFRAYVRWLSEFTKAHFGTLVREQPARRNPLFPRLFFCGLSQAYARTAAVFVDEFDAGGF